jgi:hypothetical protein
MEVYLLLLVLVLDRLAPVLEAWSSLRQQHDQD